MDNTTPEYRDAFCAYLRTGKPISLSLKSDKPSTHYIWRTRGDSKVRPSHAKNDGKIFAWDGPPATGHPGEEYGCRCIAEPYLPDVDEFIDITLTGVSDGGRRWSSRDFVDHYYNGGGRGVILRDTGNLSAIVAAYWKEVGVRFPGNHIAAAARRAGPGSFDDDFYNTYDMQPIVFSLGDTTIEGDVVGVGYEEFGIFTVSGTISFRLKDAFANPLDIGIEFGGDVYPITDEWSGSFNGRFYADESRSRFIKTRV